MFFTDKHKKSIAALHHKIELLQVNIQTLQHRFDIEQKRVDALFKLYPHGINKNGSPRKKPGRPHKKEQV